MAVEQPPPLSSPPVAGRDWAALLFRSLVISSLVACVAAGWVAAFQFLIPGWRGGYLVLLVGLVVLETLVMEQTVGRVAGFERRWGRRVTEVLLMLMILKPLTYLERGWEAFWQDARTWLLHPSLFLYDFDYLLGAFIVLVMWLLALELARALDELNDPYNTVEEHAAGLADLKTYFTFGALFLLVAVGLTQLDLSGKIVHLHSANVNTLTLMPLVYIGLGLLLFGQARLALLRAGWIYAGVPVAPGLVRRWGLWGLLFVGGIALVALLLPAGSTLLGFYLFLWLGFMLTVLGTVLFYLLALLFWLLLWPFRFLLNSQALTELPPPELQVPSAPAAATTGGGPPWLPYLQATLFWVAVAVVLFVLVRLYLRDRPRLGNGGGLWSWLVNGWRAFWDRWRGVRRRVGAWWQQITARPVPVIQAGNLNGWERWRARNERERVRRLYRVLLERAAQAGHPRAPTATPYEYVGDLTPHVAGEEEALSSLTQAFVEARYGRREFQPEEVGWLRQHLNRLRARLRDTWQRSAPGPGAGAPERPEEAHR